MRSFSGTPGKNPKYLSDSLTPWYGTWTRTGPGLPNIGYTGLPIGDAIARIYYQIVNPNGAIAIEFNEPQNVYGRQVEFYYKWDDPDARTFIYFSGNPFASYTTSYIAVELNADGAAPTVWTKKSINPEAKPIGYASSLTGVNAMLCRLKTIVFYGFSMTAPRTLEISGMTVRRL
jgi:hypothetical protein